MQRSWRPQNAFATDYQDIGSYRPIPPPSSSTPMYNSNPNLFAQRPSMYPTTNYNRSPAPFTNVHAPQSHANLHLSQDSSTYQPPVQPYIQQAVPQDHQFYEHQESTYSQQTMDKREQPEEDEYFPSYKELRNVFLNKQREAEVEERQRVPLRKSWQSSSPKVPPPTAKKPQQIIFSQAPPLRTSSLNIQQQTPIHQQQQQAQTQWQQPQVRPQTQWQQPQVRPQAQWQQSPSSQYMEIPIQHSTRVASRPTQLQPSQQELSYRAPMSINVASQPTLTSYDKPSPRVVITSNSPRSPQKAMYRPDGEEGYIIPTPRRHSVSITPHSPFMSSSANQPRRRTSYAEIMISSSPNSLPRNINMRPPGGLRRSISQITTSYSSPDGQEEPEFYPSFNELKQQFRQRERHETSHPQSFGTMYGKGSNQPSRINSDGYTRVNITSPEESTARRQAAGWSATLPTTNVQAQPMISTGPNVQSTPNSAPYGRSAAHLQYNSPLSLYSKHNAQEALDRDTEAAELLKIAGGRNPALKIHNSPTLRAVLKEDYVKQTTGHKPDFDFYYNHKEYGPGVGPLRQYEETPDTLCQTVTVYNKNQDKSLTYPMWSATA